MKSNSHLLDWLHSQSVLIYTWDIDWLHSESPTWFKLSYTLLINITMTLVECWTKWSRFSCKLTLLWWTTIGLKLVTLWLYNSISFLNLGDYQWEHFDSFLHYIENPIQWRCITWLGHLWFCHKWQKWWKCGVGVTQMKKSSWLSIPISKRRNWVLLSTLL